MIHVTSDMRFGRIPVEGDIARDFRGGAATSAFAIKTYSEPDTVCTMSPVQPSILIKP